MIFFNRLQVKIILPIIIAIVIIFSIMIYTVERMERDIFHDDWLTKTKVYANSISTMIEKEMEGKRPFIVRDLIHKFKKIPGIKNLQVIRTNGKEAFKDFETFYKVKEIYQFSHDVIEEYMNLEEGKADVVSDEKIKDVLREGKEKEFYGYDKNGKVFYDYYLPVLNKPACHKCHGDKEKIRGILKISLSDEKFAEHLNNHLIIMLWISVATVIILIIVISWIVYNLVSKPLNAVIKTKKEIINMIVKEVQRLDSMLKDLLMFSKPIVVNPKMHDLNKLITDTINLLEFKCRKGKISIDTSLSNIPNILIDGEKMQQVLLNVCLNAVESMKENGKLTITTSTDKPNGCEYIQIEISDTGCGISPEIIKNIFTPFFTTKKDGSGLGLPISLRIVEKHKGTIKVESVVDKGSKFVIVLPLENSLNIVEEDAEYNDSEVLL